MVIDSRFDIGQTVYIKTDVQKLPRMITGFNVRGAIEFTGRTEKPVAIISYELTCGESVSWHYEFELTDKQPDKLYS